MQFKLRKILVEKAQLRKVQFNKKFRYKNKLVYQKLQIQKKFRN